MQGEPRELVALTKARDQLAACVNVDEVKDIIDKAEAIRQYSKEAGLGLDAVIKATLIKTLAERRAGELLKGMELNGGDRKSELRNERVKLSDLGITSPQSHRWQTMAELAECEIDAIAAEALAKRKEFTSKQIYALGKKRKAKQTNGNGHEVVEGVVGDLYELINEEKRFATIYADPPWQYGNQGTRAATDNHYPTMTVAEICAEPVDAIASDDARLFLWTTTSFLRDSFDVIDAWGFEYKSQIIWCKPQMGIGNYCRVSHEILMIAARPKAGAWDDRDKNIKSWQVADRQKHSKKPGEFRGIVERLSPAPYLEMYGREVKEGWTTYGNQVVSALFGT